MSHEWKGIIPWIMCLIAAIAIVLGVLLWKNHHIMSGMFIGFAVGIGCTVVAYRVSEWISPHRRTEVPPG